MAEKLVIKVDGDTKAYKKDLADLSKANKGFEVSLASAAKLTAVAIAGVSAAVISLVNIYKVQEQAEIRTQATLKATGFAAGLTADELFKMASGLQEVTTFGDEAIIGGQNLLLTFRKIGGDLFPRVTEVMLDMSTAMGTGLKESAIQLGKALNDPILGISALTRVGITFSAEQKNMIKSMQQSGDIAGAQTIILKELENQFGGVARAAAEGTGALAQSSNAVGDLFEEMGRRSLPVVSKISTAFGNLATKVKEWLVLNREAEESADGVSGRIENMEEKLDSLRANLKRASSGASIENFLFGGSGRAKVIASQIEEIEANLLKAKIELIAADKKEFEASEEFKLQKQKQASDLQLEEAKSLAARKQEIENEIQNLKTVTEEEQRNLDVETLQEQLETAAIMKLEAQALELSAKGKHADALKLIEAKRLKDELKLAKQKQAAEAQLVQARLSMAVNASALFTAIAGSESKTAFAISKAVAAAQIIVNGVIAEGKAAAQLGVFSPPAITAIRVNTGLQLATVAATAIQGFENGGIVTGKSGIDANTIKATNDEVIVPPETSFQDLVDAGRAFTEGGEGSGGQTEVIITMNENLIDFIEAQVVERRAIGTSSI